MFAAVHRDRLLAAVACVLLACGGPGPESNSAPDEDCNLVGCSDVVTAEIDVPVVSAHLLTGTRLEVCRNGSCAHSTLRLESNDLLLCRGAAWRSAHRACGFRSSTGQHSTSLCWMVTSSPCASWMRALPSRSPNARERSRATRRPTRTDPRAGPSASRGLSEALGADRPLHTGSRSSVDWRDRVGD